MPCCGAGASSRPRKKPSRTVAVLLSCCLFLLIVCACLLTALVFVGKHILYNYPTVRHVARHVQPLDRSLGAERRFWRLPNDTRPVLYDLTLLPDLGTGEFKGSVNITVRVTGFRKDFVVHSKTLFIAEVRVVADDGRAFQVIDVDENLVDEVVIITTRERIFPGMYYLYIKFGGSLKDRLTGFYRSHYRSSSGRTR